GESSGVVPSREWKAGQSREPWYPGETVIAGIGQGYWVTTALQMARGIAAIANGGELHPLRLLAEKRPGYDAPLLPLPARPAAPPPPWPAARPTAWLARPAPRSASAAAAAPAWIRARCPTTCATRPCSRAMPRPRIRPSPWWWWSSTAATAAPPRRRSRAGS